MTKTEKQYYIDKSCTGYFSGYGGIEIKDIRYGINDYCIFVAGAWCSNKSAHKTRIDYNASGRAYFRYNGNRIYFDECLRS